MRLISIDPGGVTGWAVFSVMTVPSAGLVLWEGKRVQDCLEGTGQLTSQPHHAALWRLLQAKRPDTIICERFEHRNNDFTELISCEYIGICKAYAELHGLKLVMQGASQAFPFDERGQKVQRLGWQLAPYTTWKDANAALKHLVYYLCTNNDYPKLKSTVLMLVTGR